MALFNFHIATHNVICNKVTAHEGIFFFADSRTSLVKCLKTVASCLLTHETRYFAVLAVFFGLYIPEKLISTVNLACVASVSARVRPENWDESKKKE